MTMRMHKHRFVIAACFALVVWLALVAAVLLPDMQRCDELAGEIQMQQTRLTLLQSGASRTVLPRRAGRLLLGPEALLRAARQAGLASLSAEAVNEGYQLSGEASLGEFAAWLTKLSEVSSGVSLAKVDLAVEVDGRLHFSLTASETGGDEGELAKGAWPLSNPFCHTASLEEALMEAAVPPLKRYALSDIHWIGRAKLGRVLYVLLALPGGETVSAQVGDTVGQEQAQIESVSAKTVRLRLPTGRVVLLKQERGE